jgi:hypothetical protein
MVLKVEKEITERTGNAQSNIVEEVKIMKTQVRSRIGLWKMRMR